jgi:hypothetical protein
MRYLPILVYVALAVYCVTDAVQHPQRNPYGLPKWAWVLIIVVFPYIGAITWLVLKFTRGDGGQRSQPLAPDDDPEYLRWLREQERRRKRG